MIGSRRIVPSYPRPGAALVVVCGLLLWVPALAGSKPAAKPAETEGGWSDVTPEEKALTSVPQDPQAPAVVLSKERTGRIMQSGDDWVNALSYHWRLKVLTERGKEYGEIHIRATKGSRVSNLQARTIKPDGTIVPVSQDQIFEKVVQQVGDYKISELVFHFPAVEPGSILEYRYDRHDAYLVYLDPWFFEGPEFTVRSKVTQAIPGGMGYGILCDLCPNVQPTVGDWHEGKMKGQLYSMELTNLPGYREETMMPPPREVSPHLEMVLTNWKNVSSSRLGRQDRFFIDWASVAKWAGSDYDRVMKEGMAALKPVVEGWVGGIGDAQERVKAVTRHVEDDFRYLSFDNVVGGSRSIDAMLKDRSADNEEKAVLLRAALKTIGVDAYPALIAGRNYGSLNPKFFSLSQFSHTVVAIARPDGTMQWIDPTVSGAPFGFIPWKDSGAGALLIKGDQGQLLELPAKNELSATRYRVTIKPGVDGAAGLVVEAELLGEDALDMRQILLPVAEEGRKEAVASWLQGKRPGATLNGYTIGNLNEFEKPLTLTLQAQATGLVTVAEGTMLVHACILGCYDTDPISRANRSQPFYVDRGWNEDESVVIQPPAGMSAASMPSPVIAKSAIAMLSFSCLSQGDGSARCSREFVARRNRWPASEVANTRVLFDRVVQADQAAVAFQSGAAGAGGR